MSGWRKRQIALDIKAENARELGLDYEPIIEMAIQGHASTRDAIRWAMQQEREGCAKVCELQEQHDDPLTAWKIAAAIRARGQVRC
jgi:post-segregation antitoxin (ccd killing protein)